MLGLAERIGSYRGGEIPRHLLVVGCASVKELSIFVDESGDLGAYEINAPFYVVTCVFHDQAVDIGDSISKFNSKLKNLKVPDLPVHTGPLIRREHEYKYLSLLERKSIFNEGNWRRPYGFA